MDESKNKEFFRLKKLTSFKELADNPEMTIPLSDLCMQNQEYIAQFEHITDDKDQKTDIKPGVYSLVDAGSGLDLKKTEPRKRNLLTTVLNTQAILQEAKLFFSKLHIYDELDQPKKRGVLLYSDPGLGKSAAISQFIQDAVAEDAGTVVMLWPTAEVDASDVSKFLSIQSEYTAECTRLILVIEDIGGKVHEGYGGPRQTDAAMLNLLDGIDVTFKLPSFIIATTNFPQNLLSSLADRPGRFDRLIKLSPPSYIERIQLLEFIAKRDLTSEEKTAFKGKSTDDLSIAHLEEIVVRSRLHDKTLVQTLKEIIEHRKMFKQSFEDDKNGLGFKD